MHFFKVVPLLLVTSVMASPAPAPIPAPTPAPELQKRDCAQDNCMRAMKNRLLTAVPFCSTYTTEAAATIPTWATAQCQSNPTRVSSACNCLQTDTLKKVYGPVDGTNYTIFNQAVNIRSRPDISWDDQFNECFNFCHSYGSMCQTFSFVQMDGFNGGPGGLYLCYIYTTGFQPAFIASATNWTGNVVYQRGG
ncbi:hypothetical protein BS50DRAFT_578478 [Corynespora cassiicola Philippines]|uniref:Apple domain-containing protein n=1 Tax=Corynespora cassiicola Philippines TaxID=1448308 RepID=A0A2T2N7X6_CORCC|nr:hypothetical protein BS50DRAFT_578478 [Corynespora cassiicola Philippines]